MFQRQSFNYGPSSCAFRSDVLGSYYFAVSTNNNMEDEQRKFSFTFVENKTFVSLENKTESESLLKW